MSEASRPHVGRPVRSLHSPRAWIVLIVVIAAGLGLDIWTKYWAFEHVAGVPVELDRERLIDNAEYNPIPRHEGQTVLPAGLLDFRLVINHGAVFGIGQEQRGFFIAFTVLATAIGIFAFAAMTSTRQWLAHIGIGLVLAGGIGNLYDRIVYGVVRDFLHMLPDWHLPFGLTWFGGASQVFPWVFNIADVLLLAGMAMLLIHVYRVEARQKAEQQAAESSQSPAAGESTAD